MVDIYTVCKGNDVPPIVPQLKEWRAKLDQRVTSNIDLDTQVNSFPNLRHAALRSRANDICGSILLIFGHSREEITDAFNGFRSPFQLFVQMPKTRYYDNKRSMFSFLGEQDQSKPKNLQACFFNDSAPTPSKNDQTYFNSVTRSIIRYSTKRKLHDDFLIQPLIKPGQTLSKVDEDLVEQYFRLRYRVWKEMAYINPQLQCGIEEWELDYTDRTAIPLIALHRQTGKIVGSVRLITAIGKANKHFNAIETYIKQKAEQSGSKRLLDLIAYPANMPPSFDLNEAFEGFNQYYHSLAKRNLKRGEVSRLIVAPEYRGQGIGSALMDELVHYSCAQAIDVLFLSCAENNEDKYNKCGFTRVPGLESHDFVNAPDIAIVMERRAASSKGNTKPNRRAINL